MHTQQQSFLTHLRLRDDGIPIYVQIREQFLAAIASGTLLAGSQLPTMREVAVALKVDLNTVRHAYDELARRGAIELVRGRGSFVATQPSPAPIDADPLDQLAQSTIAQSLEAGFPPVELAIAFFVCAREPDIMAVSFVKSVLQSADTRESNPLVKLLAGLFAASAVGSFLLIRFNELPWADYAVPAVLLIVALLIPKSLMVANQWEKGIVLRLGRLRSISGPGLFWIVPFYDEVASWIDQRIQTTEFNAEQALTRDTVPVNVDAIVFWQVHDTQRAALEIVDYRSAIERVSQTTLRETIGSSPLSALLSQRDKADAFLKETIGSKIGEWVSR